MHNIFQHPNQNSVLANNTDKKSEEETYGKGKYFYDVFYEEIGEAFTGCIKGDNQKHARKNFIEKYGNALKIKHLQRLKN